MSDFYRRRRTAIKDVSALVAFFLGMTWSGLFTWPLLGADITRRGMTHGIATFVAIVLTVAVAAGACGLALGSCGAVLWERHHRAHRRTHPA